ncbi:Hypothetical predicted protein, partial [Olea europaea subsp. europaea]
AAAPLARLVHFPAVMVVLLFVTRPAAPMAGVVHFPAVMAVIFVKAAMIFGRLLMLQKESQKSFLVVRHFIYGINFLLMDRGCFSTILRV